MINVALRMRQFSMENTLLTFQDQVYRYGVDEDPMMRGLTIGGYDSAWVADIW